MSRKKASVPAVPDKLIKDAAFGLHSAEELARRNNLSLGVVEQFLSLPEARKLIADAEHELIESGAALTLIASKSGPKVLAAVREIALNPKAPSTARIKASELILKGLGFGKDDGAPIQINIAGAEWVAEYRQRNPWNGGKASIPDEGFKPVTIQIEDMEQ